MNGDQTRQFWPVLFYLRCVSVSLNYGILCLLFLHNTCIQSKRCNLFSHWVTLKVFLCAPVILLIRSFPSALVGTTCLVALLSDRELTVANVGDSRGVLCDKDGNAVALSHDHKPYQLKERKRIKRAGRRGFWLHFCLDSICWCILEQQFVK